MPKVPLRLLEPWAILRQFENYYYYYYFLFLGGGGWGWVGGGVEMLIPLAIITYCLLS